MFNIMNNEWTLCKYNNDNRCHTIFTLANASGLWIMYNHIRIYKYYFYVKYYNQGIESNFVTFSTHFSSSSILWRHKRKRKLTYKKLDFKYFVVFIIFTLSSIWL